MIALRNAPKKACSALAALALATATGLAGTTGAAAADRYVLEPVEETQVEFGTGWYIRGDLGIAVNGVRNVSVDRDITSDPSVPFEGRESDTDGSFTVGAAVGYQFTNNIRGDISYDFVSRHDEGVRGFTSCAGEAEYTDAMGSFVRPANVACFKEDQSEHTVNLVQANAYYDFAPSHVFSPFLGLGFGVARVAYDIADDRYTCNPIAGTTYRERCLFGDFGEKAVAVGVERSGSTYHLAGSLMGGVSYRMSKNISLDTEYRFTRIHSDPLFGGESGHTDVNGNLHQVKFGLRYDIW